MVFSVDATWSVVSISRVVPFGLTAATDTVETYFDSHVDLLQRKLQKHS